jgi:hypothetical protein
VRTYGVGAVVVALDDERNAVWLASPDGSGYRAQMDAAALTALENVKPPSWGL